ncbi:MAG TPA: hypothetical protein VGN34_31810 [Ktedonobacteraceae bacterium]
MQQDTIDLTVKDEKQNVQELLNEQAEVELSDADLAEIRGAMGIPFNHTFERYHT